jgi:hypothetical protein
MKENITVSFSQNARWARILRFLDKNKEDLTFLIFVKK